VTDGATIAALATAAAGLVVSSGRHWYLDTVGPR